MHLRRCPTNCSIIFQSFPQQRAPILLKCFASSSQQSTSTGTQTTEEEEKKEKRKNRLAVLSNFMNVLRAPFSGRRLGQHEIPPTSLSLVDPRGGPVPIDMDVPLGEIAREAPKTIQADLKKLSREIDGHFGGGKFSWTNPFTHPVTRSGMDESRAEHTEAFIEYQFKTDEDMEKWQTGSDSDSAEGYSKCDLYRSDRGTAIFEGVISNRVVKDGRTNRAGWCSMITIDMAAFNRKRTYEDWEYYNHLLIKCRGDGRSYKVMLHWPSYHDVTWANSHSYQLHTHGGPYWQFEQIPFSRFFYTAGGRIQDGQSKVPIVKASKIGIVLMDRIEGPFRLELGFIGCMHDQTHLEEFAYETYNSMLAHPAM